jgi:hypothetical protein
MLNKSLVILMTIGALGVSSAAMARGGGGSGGGKAMHGHMHGHMGHHHHFQNNPFLLGGWGWGGPYGEGGYSNNTIVAAYPQPLPAAEATGSAARAACHWNEDTFTVPSSAGGKRPITIVSCR